MKFYYDELTLILIRIDYYIKISELIYYIKIFFGIKWLLSFTSQIHSVKMFFIEI